MTIFIGLGNPGEKYHQTRHNAGWMFVDNILHTRSLMSFVDDKKVFSQVSRSSDILLAKPQTFMNESGKAVQAILKWYGNKALGDRFQVSGKTDQYSGLFIAYDDLDIELGKYKIQFGSGPKVHNGVNSIRDYLKSDQFWNIRIGVDSRNGDRSLSGSEYVLQKFNKIEKQKLESVFPFIWDELTSKAR